MEPLRRTFRGYEPAQVDRLVSGLYSQLEARLRELEELRHQNTRLNEELADYQESDQNRKGDAHAIQEALVSAHRQADEVLAQARKESELLLQIARETAHRYQEDLKGRIDDLNWQIERLTLQKKRFQGSLRELLESHLTLLSEGGVRPDSEPGSTFPSDFAAVEMESSSPVEAESSPAEVPEPQAVSPS